MQGGGHRRVRFKTFFYLFCKSLFTHGDQKLFHIHRMQGLNIDLAYRERKVFSVYRYAEQAAESGNMVAGSTFAKIF